MTRTASPTRWAGRAGMVLPVLLAVAACGGGGAAPSVTAIPTPAPSTAAPAPTASPTPTPTPTAVVRTSAELKRALLSLQDVPAGFEVDPGADDGGGVTATSGEAGCAALVRLLRSTTLPGSMAHASVSFSGGNDGPEVSEDLDALGSKQAAGAFVQGYRRAVTGCRTVTVHVPGVGSSSMEVREISFAKLGDDTFAARMRARSGPLEGLEMVQVGVQSGDVVVGMNSVGLEGADAESAAGDAVKKAARTLGTGTSI